MSSFYLVGWNPTPHDGRWEVYEISDRVQPRKRVHQLERESKNDTIRAIKENEQAIDLGYLSRTQTGDPSAHEFKARAIKEKLRGRGELFNRESMVVWHSAGRWKWSRSAPTNQPMPIRSPIGSEDTKELGIRAAMRDAERDDLLGVLVFDTDDIVDGFRANLPVWNFISHQWMTRGGKIEPIRYKGR